MPDWRYILLVAAGALVLWLMLFASGAHAFDNAGAVAIAVEHYGEPCGGSVAFAWDHLGSDVNARSSWVTENVESPQVYSDCTITWSLDVPWTAAKFCTVTEHEVGHLTGHVHEEDAIMATYYTVPSPECTAAYPPRMAWRPGPKWRAYALDRNPRAAVASRHSRIHRSRRNP